MQFQTKKLGFEVRRRSEAKMGKCEAFGRKPEPKGEPIKIRRSEDIIFKAKFHVNEKLIQFEDTAKIS